MKLVSAIIKTHKVEDVRLALTDLGIHGMTATEVKGFGRQSGQKEIYRGAEYVVNFVPKVKLEIAVDNSLVDQTVETITNVARSGEIGDGKIFIFDLGDAVRIRTGETGEEAL